MKRYSLILSALLVSALLFACGGDDASSSDGDSPAVDGDDIPQDGDITDGDLSGGDTSDGDSSDEDRSDGDTTDGDISDGDSDDERPIEGGALVVPETIEFGAVLLGQDASRTIEIVNDGPGEVRVSIVRISDGTSEEYEIIGDVPSEGSPRLLRHTEKLEVTIRYAPLDAGADEGLLQIVSDAANGNLIEVGLIAEQKGESSLNVAETLSFGEVPLRGFEDLTLPLRIANLPDDMDGNRTLQVFSLTIAGADAEAFELDIESCGASVERPILLAPGDERNCNVRFRPIHPDANVATLRVASDASEGEAESIVNLDGIGAVPCIENDHPAIDFGEVDLGLAETQSVTLSNPCQLPLIVNSIVIAGGEDSVFELLEDCGLAAGGELEAGGECSVVIEYRPDEEGEATDSLIVVSDAWERENVVIDLSGEGSIPTDCSLYNTACRVYAFNPVTQGCMWEAVNEGGGCDDEEICTYNDRCNAGSCVGEVVVCESEPCLSRECNGTNSCVETPINEGQHVWEGTWTNCGGFDSGCDDSGNHNRDVTVCRSGSEVRELEHEECFRDTEGVSCDDEEACTYNDTCADGICSGIEIVCESDVCVYRNCDGTDTCRETPELEGTVVDEEPWTDCGSFDSDCDESGQRSRNKTVCRSGVPVVEVEREDCERDTDGMSCNDLEYCTYDDRCSSGVCSGTYLSCESDACMLRSCNGTSDCTEVPQNEGMITDEGVWSACSGYGGVCDETGTHSRSYWRCRLGAQEEVFEQEECTRDTDGNCCDDMTVHTFPDTCQDGVCVGQTQAPFECDANTEAVYHFNEGMFSSTANACSASHEGSIEGATWTTGRHGSALSFAAAGQRVTVPDNSAFDLIDEFTIEAVIKPNSNYKLTSDTKLGRIVAKWDAVHQGQYIFGADRLDVDGLIHPALYMGFGNRSEIHHSALTIPTGDFIYVALSFYRGELCFVVGSDVDCMDIQTDEIPNRSYDNDDLIIGNSWTNRAWDYWFDGAIDELRFSNIARYESGFAFACEQSCQAGCEDHEFCTGGSCANVDWDADGIFNRGYDHICGPADAPNFANCIDNCPYYSNPDQEDANNNGIGDTCESVIGCSDGSREAFLEVNSHSRIAGCAGEFTSRMLRDARTNTVCGHGLGTVCPVAEDLCAPGWHLCMKDGYILDISNRVSEAECNSAIGGEGYFLTGSSHCHESEPCDMSQPLPCTDDFPCSQPVTCGINDFEGTCNSLIWPEQTRVSPDYFRGCADADPGAEGVLCCKD